MQHQQQITNLQWRIVQLQTSMISIKERLQCLKSWTTVLNVTNIGVQIWGLFAVWSESNGLIMKDKDSDGYRQWWLIANFMLSIRVMFYAVILLTFTIFACLICCQR